MKSPWLFLPVLHIFAKLVVLFSCLFFVPVFVSLWYQDGSVRDFLYSAGLGFLFGTGLWLLTQRFERELRPRDGFVLVSLLWMGFAATASIPFMIAYPDLRFSLAFFESMSGLTTTGATVISGLEYLPPALNFWRHFLNWIGGMGIIVLAVAILPLLGIGGMQLFRAEATGPQKDQKLAPRVAHVARNLWMIYSVLTLLCAVSLYLAGMSPFDAINHAFSTLSLGGFSTRDAGIGSFNSIQIELILSIFMLLAAMNFTLHFLFLHKKSWKIYWQDEEVRSMLFLIGLSMVILTLYLSLHGTLPWWLVLRQVSFNLISMATDAGFTTVDYGQWPIFASLWMLLLSCMTACAGSTGGGIKMMRTLILTKQSLREMKLLVHPRALLPIKVNGHLVADRVLFSVLAFVFVYFMSVAVLSFILLASGMDFLSAWSAIVACINNAGPGLGEVGPANNYGHLSELQLWICSLAMLLGRLEIFTLLILLNPILWKK